jgi:hypothetical protein
MQEPQRLRNQKRYAKTEILREGKNVRLQGNEEFLLWEMYYQGIINTVARTEKVRKEVWEFTFCHQELPIEYHFNPFEEYAKDDFEKTRCCWMMLGYLVSKNKADWLEIIELGNKLQMDGKHISYDDTLFGVRFKKFVEEGMNNYNEEDEVTNGQTFDEKMMKKAIKLYQLEDPIFSDFLDYEIYDQEDEIMKNQHIRDDVDKNIIKKTIRWKTKELVKLKQLPYFETEEERRKKVRLKVSVRKGIWDFDRFIYKLGNTTCNVEKSYAKWQESHDEYNGWNSEEGQLHKVFDGSKESELSTEKDTSLP